VIEDLPSLALFARVVDLRSFSAAAREANIAKSAVSKRIAGLEARFGVRLLNRSTRALSLTEEGLRFYEHCSTVIAAARAAEESVSSANREPRGTLRVNAPITFAQMHLARALAAFADAQRDVAIDLSTEDRLVDVVEGGFDLVVRIGRPADSALAVRKLARDRLVLCASPGYLERAGTPACPEDLVRHDCLHYSLVPLSAEWRFRRGTAVLHVPVKTRFASTNGTVLREAALANAGIAVLPSFMIATDVERGRLRLVLEGARRAEISIVALYAHRERVAARTRAALDFLTRWFAKSPLSPLARG
jgi:DNA-binding transcriptional LysR family regulator